MSQRFKVVMLIVTTFFISTLIPHGSVLAAFHRGLCSVQLIVATDWVMEQSNLNRAFRIITFVVPVAYLVIVSGFLIAHGVWFSPDQFFIAALLIALLFGRSKQFLRDWSTPVILFLSYDYLRGLVPRLIGEAHIYPMIRFDRAMFGTLPPNTLQDWLYTPGKVQWYDYFGTILYMTHFIVPLIVGYIFWITDWKYFKNYFLVLLLLSYAAFVTYVLFPTVPPWMAADKGIIPPVAKVMDKVFTAFPESIDLPTVYRFVGVNLVAAVPSLHAAYPWMTLLFFVRKFNVMGLLISPYVLAVWFYTIYLGEHYVFDILVGVLYASVIFFLVVRFSND